MWSFFGVKNFFGVSAAGAQKFFMSVYKGSRAIQRVMLLVLMGVGRQVFPYELHISGDCLYSGEISYWIVHI